MILRLVRARLRPGSTPALLTRLREQTIPEARTLDGLISFTYGFRFESGETWAITLSGWRDFDAIVSASAGGELDRPAGPSRLGDLVDDVTVEHFELVEPVPEGIVTLDGAVLGMVQARVKPNMEAGVNEMIRAVRPVVEAAGVIGLHVGRRVLGRTTEVVVLASWPDRASLRRFARQRPNGVIDPNFLAKVDRWSFETYDCISPDRLLLPPSGAAVILLDNQGKYVEASPAIEAVIGVPGELVIGRTVGDLTPPAERQRALDRFAALLAGAEQQATIPLLRPDGIEVTVMFRAKPNCPEPGLHAAVLSLPSEPPDLRPVEKIVAQAFGRPVVAA